MIVTRAAYEAQAQLVRQALAALQETNVRMIAVLQAMADAERLKAETTHEQLALQRSERERIEAMRRSLEKPEEDLPEIVQTMVQRFAGNDSALRSSLAAYARKQLAANVDPSTVANQIARGADPKQL